MSVDEPRVRHCLDFITYSILLKFSNQKGESFTLKMKREWTDCTLENTEQLQLALQAVSHMFMTTKGEVDYMQYQEELEEGICSWQAEEREEESSGSQDGRYVDIDQMNELEYRYFVERETLVNEKGWRGDVREVKKYNRQAFYDKLENL